MLFHLSKEFYDESFSFYPKIICKNLTVPENIAVQIFGASEYVKDVNRLY